MPADPYRVWLGIPKGVKHPNYYHILAIAQGESSVDVIRSAIEQRRGYIRSKLGQGDDAAVKQILALIDEASATLLVPELKHGYDRHLGLYRGSLSKRKKAYILPPWFESRVERIYGEGSGLILEALGLVAIIVGICSLFLLSSFLLPGATLPHNDGIAEATPLEKLVGPSTLSRDRSPIGLRTEQSKETPRTSQPVEVIDKKVSEPYRNSTPYPQPQSQGVSKPKEASSAGSLAPSNAIKDPAPTKPPSLGDEWVSMFDGSSLQGWEFRENGSSWKIENRCIVATGEARSHLYYIRGDELRDFRFQCDVKMTENAASGIYYHTRPVDSLYPVLGLEFQLINKHPTSKTLTGSLYGIRDVYPSPVENEDWFKVDIIVKGKRVVHIINDKVVVDYTEPANQKPFSNDFARLIGSGRIALQCTPPAAKTYFRNLQVRQLRLDETPDVASPNIESNNNAVPTRPTALPRPTLYISGDRDIPSIPSNLNFTRMEGDYVDGKIGKAVQFNGKQMSELNVPFPTGNASRTLAFWMKSNRGPTNLGIHVVTFGPVEKAKPFGVMEAAGKWRFFDLNGGLDSQKPVDQKWHHHAVSFDGKTVRYYIDGNLSSEVQRSLATVNGSLKIGGLGDPINNFVGILDELYMFNQSLSNAQIATLYNQRTGFVGSTR